MYACRDRDMSPLWGHSSVYVTLFSWKFDPHSPPRNANNVEPYTFVALFSGKADTPPPPLHHLLRYVTLEWPLFACNRKSICAYFFQAFCDNGKRWHIAYRVGVNISERKSGTERTKKRKKAVVSICPPPGDFIPGPTRPRLSRSLQAKHNIYKQIHGTIKW